MSNQKPKTKIVGDILAPTPLEELLEKHKANLPKMSPKVKNKLLEDAKFFSQHGLKTDLPAAKKAYPNFESYKFIQPPRDTKKWIQAARDYYYRMHKGIDSKQAFNQATQQMDHMEKLDFERWLHFYQEGNQNKYKTAQVNYWENANQAGYFVPIHPDRPQATHNNERPDLNRLQSPDSHPDIQDEAKRDLIERTQAKIIGRLDSAEKLIRSREGQMFVGKEMEAILSALYQLKTKIQMVNKISTSTRLYEDLIVREANILNHKGFVKGAALLTSLANGAMPNPAEAPFPTTNVGMPGNWPGEGPGMTPEQGGLNDTATPPDPAASAMPAPGSPGLEAGKNTGPTGDSTDNQLPTPSSISPDAFPGDGLHLPGEVVANPVKSDEKPVSEGLKQFLDGLDTGTDSVDLSEAEDEALEMHESEADYYYNGLIVMAQDAPGEVGPALSPEAAPPEDKTGLQQLEVSEEQTDPEAQASKDFDSLIDTAFSGLTVQDAVTKLEEVAKVFKVREISRQLSLVDLMLSQLGLAALFPSLGEAINKSLESNQYIATRIDDILARLQGAVNTKNVDLQGNTPEINPQAQQVKEQLTQENDKEKARKKMRKELANEALTPGKAAPEVELGQDLGQPVKMPTPPPAPIR